MKKLRVAINGFGRIGRNVLRAFLEYHHEFDEIEIVAINDVADCDTLLHLLNYDSTHGRLTNAGIGAKMVVAGQETSLLLNKGSQQWVLRVFNEPDPEKLDWKSLNVDVVLECTGKFREYQRANLHRQAGAKQVIIGAAPFDEIDGCVVLGVNDKSLNRDLAIISGVSCTTQAIVPLLSVLDEVFGVVSAMMTEIHAVTADQTVLDTAHRDLRRARASGYNIIPTTSSSIGAAVRVLPQLAGRLNGHSVRVPTQDVAAIDVSLVLQVPVSVQAVNELLKQTSQTQLKGIMGYSDEPLVSSDFIHDRHSLVIDSLQTMSAGEQLKVFAWYDNEWGYANRLLQMCQKLANC